MSIQEPRPIDRRTAEHLLSGAPVGAHDGRAALAALLTAAAAPGRPDELARERASLAAFRTAQLAPVPRPRSLSVVKTAVMKVLTVKAAVVLAATTAGGVALAAGTGTLPNPLAPGAAAVSSGLSAAHPTATQSSTGHNPGGSANSKRSNGSKSPDASKAPSPSLLGLCLAYSAGINDKSDRDKNDSNGRNGNDARNDNNGRIRNAENDSARNERATRDKALDNPAFAALIAAAGGKDKVEQFCRTLFAASARPNSDTPDGAKPGGDRRGGQRGRDHDENDHTDGFGNRTTASPKP